MHLYETVRENHGAARVAELIRAGFPRWLITGAVRNQHLHRPRQGWVALPSVDSRVARSVVAGGRVGCVSALPFHGIWTPDENRLDVAIPAHAGRIPGAEETDFERHWTSTRWRDNGSPIENPYDTLRQVVMCCSRESAVAVLDSALNRKIVGHGELFDALSHLPARFASIVEEIDGASQAGHESLARVRFRGRGLTVRAQVYIPGAGHVNMVIGDRLVFETDGRKWHEGADAFERDRARDLILNTLGYVVIRVSHDMVMHQWPLVELAVASVVARNEHLWSAVHRRDPRLDLRTGG